MPLWAWIVIAVGIVVVVAVAVWLVRARRRTGRLQDRFGREYERVVEHRGDRRRAESELTERERRREELQIRDLPPAARRRYAEAWAATQARFVDAPSRAVGEADRLVMEVMTARGYPMADFDRRADDISVDHPDLVENFRSAHSISQASDRDRASTEDLRRAMVHYRALFEELLADHDRPDVREVG